MEIIHSPLAGAVVQKVRLGAEGMALDLRAPGRSFWVEIVADGKGLRLRGGEGKSTPLGPCPDQTLVRYARKHLDGAKFLGVGPSHVDFLTPQGIVRLSLLPHPPLPGKIPRFVPRLSPVAEAEGLLPSEDDLRDAAATHTPPPEPPSVAAARGDLVRSIEKEKKRTVRTLAAVRGDHEAIAKARNDADLARYLVLAAKAAPAGTEELSANSGVEGLGVVTLLIDKRVSPQRALERVFTRSKRLGARESFVMAREAALREALDVFEGLRIQATALTSTETIEQLRETFRTLARHASTTAADRTRSARSEGAPRLPYKTFVGNAQREILVGRSSAKNHELTFRVAKGSDVWLHAREVEGAHVVVRVRRDEELAPEVLLDAAHLAVYFSRARDEGLVDVQYTNVGSLKKLPTPGAVVVTREKVLAVRVDDARTQALLKSER